MATRVGIVSLALGFFVVPLILGSASCSCWSRTGDSVEDATERFADTDNVTPLVLGFLNVSLASLIPVASC